MKLHAVIREIRTVALFLLAAYVAILGLVNLPNFFAELRQSGSAMLALKAVVLRPDLPWIALIAAAVAVVVALVSARLGIGPGPAPTRSAPSAQWTQNPGTGLPMISETRDYGGNALGSMPSDRDASR